MDGGFSMMDLQQLQFDEDVQAMTQSLAEGIETATPVGGEAQWRRHFRTSMAMCIG